MIRLFRLRIPIFVSAAMMLCAVSLAMNGDQPAAPLTWPEISLAIWLRYGAAVGTSIAATWLLLASYERRQDERMRETGARLDAVLTALQRHDDSPYAHASASEHNHAPMNGQMASIEQKLDQLIEEHRIINGRCPAGQ